MRLIMLGLLAAAMAGCATGYNPRYYFNEVQVVNLSGSPIRNVDWRVVGSDRSLTCTDVATNAMCDDRFGPRRYPQQGIQLGWTHGDGGTRAEMLTPRIPAYFPFAFPLRIVLEIGEDGSVEAFYEQDEPGRDNDFDP